MNLFNKKFFRFDQSGESLAIYPKFNYLKINNKLLKDLKKISKKNNNCNLRICLHKKKKDKLQNMIVLLNIDSMSKFRIHKHKFKDEIYQILDGKLKFLIFKKKKISKKIILQKNRNILLRLNKDYYHQTLPLTKIVIFHEIRQGPFLKNDSIFLKN